MTDRKANEPGYVRELRKLVGNRPLLVPGGRAVVLNDAGEVLFHVFDR